MQQTCCISRRLIRPVIAPLSPRTLYQRSLRLANSRSTPASVPLRKQLKDEAKAHRVGGKDDFEQFSLSERDLEGWELTVGIEIHAQLNTSRKLFSVAPAIVPERANTSIAPFDLSIPGSLPIFQKATLVPALRAALALNCVVQATSRFDRKHYFYHDQPAGYQITQYYEPFARNGHVVLGSEDGVGGEEIKIGIKQVQLEQDTARTQEQDSTSTLIDYNRSGMPLIEIISLPHIHSPDAASAYVRKVQALLLSVNAVTTGMEMGGLRADVNVSVRRKGDGAGPYSYDGISGLGQRTEIKNISTVKGVADAIKAERDRQISVIRSGGQILGETRGWSITSPKVTRRLRGKEGEVDYRYMPDPDLSPLYLSAEVVDHLYNTLPKTHDDLFELLTSTEGYAVTPKDAKVLLSVDTGERLEYFQEVVERLRSVVDEEGTKELQKLALHGQAAVNWVLQELGALMKTTNKQWNEIRVSPISLTNIIKELNASTITMSSARKILKYVSGGDTRSIHQIITEEKLSFESLSDTEYATLAATILSENPKPAKEIREKGKTGKLMFLVGLMMRRGPHGQVEALRAEQHLRQAIAELP